MRLRKVAIENFRCYKDKTEVDIDDLSVFVGTNDSGKSSILEALDIFFNEGKGEIKLTDDDINIYAKNSGEYDITISCTFEDIPEPLVNILEENDIHLNNSLITVTKAFGNNKMYINDIEISKKKQLVGKIKEYLPIYGLFKVDRTNTDDNQEIKDPLIFTIDQVLKEQDIKDKLQEVAFKIKDAVNKVANGTLDKLKQFNDKIANELTPHIPDIEELKWRDVFKKIGIYSDNNISLNKRGSGVRRLVLLSFFLFEAERKRKMDTNIIYAIEEPETSLHPDQQKQFIGSLLELSQNEKVQVLITTHSPYIAQMTPVDSLRFINRDNQHNSPKVISSKENKQILSDIAKKLGIHYIITKVIIFVEGKTDKMFLMNINKNIEELKNIIDLETEIISETIAIIPMNGSNLKEWVQNNHLKGSSVLEFHLYDSDRDDYKKIIEEVNRRKDGSIAFTTNMKEIENYIYWKLIEKEFDIKIPDDVQNKEKWKNFDISKWLSQGNRIKEKDIKERLCGKVAKNITKTHLEELGVWEEVKVWFEKIAELAKKATPH